MYIVYVCMYTYIYVCGYVCMYTYMYMNERNVRVRACKEVLCACVSIHMSTYLTHVHVLYHQYKVEQ